MMGEGEKRKINFFIDRRVTPYININFSHRAMEELMCRPCVGICNKKAMVRSTEYGVTICSLPCLSFYKYQKTTSTSLNVLFSMHGKLMRQVFVQSSVNKNTEDGNLRRILDQLEEVDERIATVICTGLGIDVSSLLREHVRLVVHQPIDEIAWLDNGTTIVDTLLPNNEDDEYSVLVSHMSKYQEGTLREIELIERQVKHDDIFLKIDFHLEELAASIDRIIKYYPREIKPDTRVRMMHQQNGRK